MKRAITSIICFSLLLVLEIVVGIMSFTEMQYPDWYPTFIGLLAFALLVLIALCGSFVSRNVESSEVMKNAHR